MQNINDHLIVFQILIDTKNFSPAKISVSDYDNSTDICKNQKNNSYLNTIFSKHLDFPDVLCFLYNTRNPAEELITFKF